MANETMDFLTALASRNGLTNGESLPAVQPRILSRFEPVSPDTGTWLMESSSEMEAVREERRNAQGREAAPTNVPSTAPSPAINPSPVQTARPAPTSTHPALRVIERVVHERETQTIRVVEREQPVQAATVPAMATRDEAATAPAPAPVQPPIVMPQPQPIQQTSALVPKPPATAKPATAPTEKPQAATAQPPDIHITIGRIDVRATTAKKSEPARNKPNAPNLERYLNSLSGAGNTSNSGGDG